jgi:hypothetical protein
MVDSTHASLAYNDSKGHAPRLPYTRQRSLALISLSALIGWTANEKRPRKSLRGR